MHYYLLEQSSLSMIYQFPNILWDGLLKFNCQKPQGINFTIHLFFVFVFFCLFFCFFHGGGGEEDIISPQINTPNPEQFTPSCNRCWPTGIIERYVPSRSILNLCGGKCQQSTIKQACTTNYTYRWKKSNQID